MAGVRTKARTKAVVPLQYLPAFAPKFGTASLAGKSTAGSERRRNLCSVLFREPVARKTFSSGRQI